MQAYVQPRVACSLDRIDIRATSTEETYSKTFTVAQAVGAPPFELSDVSTDVHMLRAAFEPAASAESATPDQGGSWRVTITAMPPLHKGQTTGNVYLHTSDPAMAVVPLPVVVSVRAEAEQASK
jgi:hypothetical protein